VPIEYPKTSESGVATVYNITGWKNPRDCWKNVSDYHLLICSFIIKLLNTNKIFSRFNIP
jgi:hypothetical protein